MIRGAFLLAGLGLLGLSWLLGGTAPLGRIALSLGLPSVAERIFDDPGWRGVAAYRAGHHDAAAAAFRASGRTDFFNLGNSLVYSGRTLAAMKGGKATGRDRWKKASSPAALRGPRGRVTM